MQIKAKCKNMLIWPFIVVMALFLFSASVFAKEELEQDTNPISIEQSNGEEKSSETPLKNDDVLLNITFDNINKLLSKTTLDRIKDQASLPQKSLKEKLADAKKRYQPYLNLVNQVYSLDDLLDPAIFKEYKKLDLKSLYLRTDKINLDAEFASKINTLVKTGLKELLIFFYEDQPTIATEQFNLFIKEHEIYINFKMVPVTAKDIEEINTDSVGRKDMLGFIGIVDYKIIYKDGLKLSLLNNKETDELILHNYAENNKKNSERNSFTLKEPEYITDSDPEAERRIKTIENHREAVHLEVSKTIENNKEKVQQLENEEELDLDLEQAEHKFNRQEAIEMADKLLNSHKN